MRSHFKSCLAAAVAAMLLSASARAELVAYYSFNEGAGVDVLDRATADGAQNLVQDDGTIGWVPSLAGFGTAGDLDGGTDLLMSGDALAGATSFTISAWVNLDNITSGYQGIFMSRDSASNSDDNWGFARENGGPNFDFRYDNNGTGSSSAGTDSAPNSTLLDTWQHLAMTWRNDGTGEVYVDGVEVATKTGASLAYDEGTGTVQWVLGSDINRRVNAQIDDIGVWKDEAFDATQIQEIYDNGLLGRDLSFEEGIAGDVNGDTFVRQDDYDIILANFSTPQELRVNGDLVNNDFVDLEDFLQWKAAPKDPEALASATAVPEPTSVVLVLGAVSGLGLIRRR